MEVVISYFLNKMDNNLYGLFVYLLKSSTILSIFTYNYFIKWLKYHSDGTRNPPGSPVSSNTFLHITKVNLSNRSANTIYLTKPLYVTNCSV